MTDFQIYLNALILLIPAFSAATCIIMIAISRRDCLSREEKRLKNIVMTYLFLALLAWSLAFCYFFYPKLFLRGNILCLASFVMTPIFLYRIIRFLTRLGQPEHFSWLHYLLPGMLAAILGVCSFFVPLDLLADQIGDESAKCNGEYALYLRIFTAAPIIRLFFMTIYYSFVGRVLIRYYRQANNSDSLVRKPAQWVIFLISVMLATIFSTFSAIKDPFHAFASPLLFLSALSIVGQHVVITYCIIRRSYLLFKVHYNNENKSKINKSGRRSFSGKLTRKRIETWFALQKPYLNKNFKITDMVEEMDVNRSMISAFINREYGMNFNRYVNSWRLQELDWLSTLLENKGKNIVNLFAQAGFSAPRQYYRALAAEKSTDRQKISTIKKAKSKKKHKKYNKYNKNIK